MTGVRNRTIAGLSVTWREFSLAEDGAGGAPSFGLWVPDDPDALLDGMTEEEFEQTDERMPYFSMVWAAAESLVVHILRGPPLDGLRVLDIGCGLGPCGLAAAARGASTTFFDWEPRALELAAASARDGGRPAGAFDFAVGDWRQPPPLEPFDLVLGADVLYERRNPPAVAAFLAGHLLPGGEAWITDPGRSAAETFPSCLREAGLRLLAKSILPPMPHGVEVTLYRISRS